jgi:isopentenyl-diphosphate delta-isomerase
VPEHEVNQSQNKSISARKSDHIRINLFEDVQSRAVTKFQDLYFEHVALPEFDLKNVNIRSQIFSKTLERPFLISSMTGGTPEALKINRLLAETAQQFGLSMGVGSQRAAIEKPELAYTFQIRDVAPDILLFANIGAVQLNYGYTLRHCQTAVDMIEADALILHLNPLQEALQPEGDTRFSGLLNKIDEICNTLQVPVIVKEVGWGISGKIARKLIDAGVSAIDVAGAGGTSWAKVEMHRSSSQIDVNTAAAFDDWGIPTADSIRQVRQTTAQLPIIASGGLKNGVDIAKSIALGANLAGIAGKFLKAANAGSKKLEEICLQLEKELRVTMFVAGAKNLSELQKTPLYSR